MRRLLTLATLFAVAGCADRTQIMLGVVTDLRAPKALDQVRLHVDGDGVKAFDQTWDLPGVPNVPFILPGSYGLYSPDGSEPKIHISVTGWKDNVQQLERRSLVSLVSGQTLFLRMGLVAGCVAKTDCATDESCIEGLCKPELMDSRALPRYLSATQISAVECTSAPYLDTSTGAALPATGTDCDSNSWCQEGICYKKVPSGDGGAPSDAGTADLAVPDLSTPLPDLATPLQWTAQLSPTTEQLNAVWATPGLVVAVGNNGTAVRLGATGPASVGSWVGEATGITANLRGMGGNDTNYVFAVGDDGAFLWRTFDGSWSIQMNGAQPFTNQFRAVWPDPQSVGWNSLWLFGADATGKNASILRSGEGFGDYTPATPLAPLNAVSGVSSDDFWVVGDNAGVLRGYDQDMAYEPSGSANLVGVWANATRVVAVSSDGTIYESDGTQVLKQTRSPTGALYGVWGSSATSVWAVGAGGLVLYSTAPGSWVVQTTPTTADLRAISGSSDGVYVVGATGIILFQAAPVVDVDGGQPDDAGTDLGTADLSEPPDFSLPP